MNVEPSRRDRIDLRDSGRAYRVIRNDLEIEAVALGMHAQKAAATAQQHRPLATLLDDRAQGLDRFQQVGVNALQHGVRARDRVTLRHAAPPHDVSVMKESRGGGDFSGGANGQEEEQ
jgi:hypothetical protein